MVAILIYANTTHLLNIKANYYSYFDHMSKKTVEHSLPHELDMSELSRRSKILL